MAIPNEEIANEIYDVLVMCGGALPNNRGDFVRAHIAEDYPCSEYRFQGHFRFGGKFYSLGIESDPWCIGYHPDDFLGNKDEEVYHSLMVAMNTILISIWEKWKTSEPRLGSDIQGGAPPAATLTFPDAGEDAVDVNFLIPSGEKVTVSYVAHTGQMDICVYKPQDGSDKKAPGAPEFTPKRVAVTCWIDEVDKQGYYVSSMLPAPPWSARQNRADASAFGHQRLATQLALSVGPNHEEIFPEKKSDG